jgi:hypothetical protein
LQITVGTWVRVIAVHPVGSEADPEFTFMQDTLSKRIGQVGRVTTEPDTDGGQRVQFGDADTDGDIFREDELEVIDLATRLGPPS